MIRQGDANEQVQGAVNTSLRVYNLRGQSLAVAFGGECGLGPMLPSFLPPCRGRSSRLQHPPPSGKESGLPRRDLPLRVPMRTCQTLASCIRGNADGENLLQVSESHANLSQTWEMPVGGRRPICLIHKGLLWGVQNSHACWVAQGNVHCRGRRGGKGGGTVLRGHGRPAVPGIREDKAQ